MNIHLSHYPNNFMKHFIANQEKYSDSSNRYLLYTNDDISAHKGNDLYELVKANLAALDEQVGDWPKYDAVYLHYLSPFLISVVNHLPKDIKIVWIFWGDDGFSQIKGYRDDYCLTPRTKKYYEKYLKLRMKWCKNPVYLYKNFQEYRNNYPTKWYKEYMKATARIDYFAHYIPEDYNLLQSNSNLNANYLDFNYMSAEQCQMATVIEPNNTRNLLIGNSADWSNNHLDLFSLLETLDLSNIEKVYVPLSYSGNKAYIDEVLEDGKIKLKDQFAPMVEFLPLNDYLKVLRNITMGVIGTICSQGAGNVVALLLQGTRVYLNSKNTLYKLFKSKGVIIFDLDSELGEHLQQGKTGYLTIEEQKNNVELVSQILGEEMIQKKYSTLLNPTNL